MFNPYKVRSQLKVDWIVDHNNSPILFQFSDCGTRLSPMPARCAAKRDKIVVVKAVVNDNICVEISIRREMLAEIGDWRSSLTPLAENAALRLLGQTTRLQDTV